jgi:hypothetical protein
MEEVREAFRPPGAEEVRGLRVEIGFVLHQLTSPSGLIKELSSIFQIACQTFTL